MQRRGIDWLDPLADRGREGLPRGRRAPIRRWWARCGRPGRRGASSARRWTKRDKLQAERAQLDAQIAQLDHSIRAIEKNNLAAQLRKDLTERLAKASARMDEITKKTIVLDMQVSEQSIRFRDLINPIKMVKPPPP